MENLYSGDETLRHLAMEKPEEQFSPEDLGEDEDEDLEDEGFDDEDEDEED